MAFTRGYLNGAYKLHHYLFGLYVMNPGLINGRPHYTSESGDFVLAFCGDSWWIQTAKIKGSCQGWAFSGWKDDLCPHHINYSWRYYIPVIQEFIQADKGLSIWCSS